MGPNAENLLLNLRDQSLTIANFSRLTAKSINIAGIDVDALRAFDLGFYGAFAMNSLRLEMGYRAWGADLTSERTPLKAGLKRFVWSNLGVFQIREMN